MREATVYYSRPSDLIRSEHFERWRSSMALWPSVYSQRVCAVLYSESSRRLSIEFYRRENVLYVRPIGLRVAADEYSSRQSRLISSRRVGHWKHERRAAGVRSLKPKRAIANHSTHSATRSTLATRTQRDSYSTVLYVRRVLESVQLQAVPVAQHQPLPHRSPAVDANLAVDAERQCLAARAAAAGELPAVHVVTLARRVPMREQQVSLDEQHSGGGSAWTSNVCAAVRRSGAHSTRITRTRVCGISMAASSSVPSERPAEKRQSVKPSCRGAALRVTFAGSRRVEHFERLRSRISDEPQAAATRRPAAAHYVGILVAE